jgi:CRP-like cAMP-binding protein
MADTRKLLDEAIAAVSKGKWKKALDAYLALEKANRQDGTWAHKAGEMYRKLERKADAVAAFARAAELYSKAGFLLKGIAVAKVALQLDPSSKIEEQLAATHGAPRLRPLAPEPAPPPPIAPAPPPPSTPAATLAELPLERLVPGAQVSTTIAVDAPEASAFDLPILIDLEGDAGAEVDAAPASASPAESAAEHEAARSAKAAQTVLPRTPLFSSLPEEDLARLIAGVRLESLAAGQTLFELGAAGESLYVVASGEVAVLAPQEIARLGEGSFFGEVALLTSAPRTATIRARVPTEVLAIDRGLVLDLVGRSPRVLEVLLHFLRQRLVAKLAATSALFSPFTPGERAHLASRFQFVQVVPRARLIEAGKRSPGLFVLLAGRARVVKGGATIATLGPRDIFGEMSLLSSAPATADVLTDERCFLLTLPRPAFAELISTHPQVLEHLGALATARSDAAATLSDA